MNDEQVKQHINKTAAALKSMQCDFVQTKHIKLLNEDMVSKGKMYYQQSNRLRWEYVSPYTYTFILNGSKVLLKNNKRNDVIDVNQNKMFKEIARIMMNSVVGTCLSDEKDFKASMSQNATEWIATLQPMRKDMRQMMQYIVLHFSKEKAMVSKVELIEKKGDKTVIELKNFRTNAAIPANTFSVN
jgi:outer membrane lipoprotein carrier protein